MKAAAVRAAGTSAPRPRRRRLRERPWWPWATRGATLAFLGLVVWLIARHARTVDWDDVLATLRDYPVATLAGAAALAAASHALYSVYDLLGRRYAGHTLPVRTVMALTFVVYVFNMNLGSLVGSVGLRARLYTRLGLAPNVIARVLSISLLTNWSGYLLLAGALFALRPLELPPDWKLDAGGLRGLGVAMLAVVAGYLAVCARWHDQTWTVRGHEIRPPTLRFASLQLAVSMANWAVIGATVWVLLQGRVSYPGVLGVLLVAAVAGVVTHVPAGLGVLEAVFVALLSHVVPVPKLLAALLAWRAIYYLAPLAAATVVYAVVEARARRDARRAGG